MKHVSSLVLSLALCLVLVAPMSSCYTMTHQVGSGAQGSSEDSAKQWYILWGLIPLNHVDSQELADGATDYTVETQHGVVDILISLVTTWVTIVPFTVTVTK